MPSVRMNNPEIITIFVNIKSTINICLQHAPSAISIKFTSNKNIIFKIN